MRVSPCLVVIKMNLNSHLSKLCFNHCSYWYVFSIPGHDVANMSVAEFVTSRRLTMGTSINFIPHSCFFLACWITHRFNGHDMSSCLTGAERFFNFHHLHGQTT